MARAAKQQKAIGILLIVILVQFVALAALLVKQDSPPQEQPQAEEVLPEVQAPQQPATPAVSPEVPEPAETEPPSPPVSQLSAEEILAGSQLIIHGLGEMGGATTLNCLEGFLEQYEQGARVFEVDLRLTADHEVILRHDWRAGWQDGISETSIPTLESFLKRPLLGQYTPLSFRDLLQLMEAYPDICVITDTKFTDAEVVTTQFEAMVRDAEELGLTYVFERMVVQVYSQLMHRVVNSIHPFPNYIYTLYTEGFNRTEATFREKAAFCQEKNITGITMWDYWWRDSFAPIAEEYGLSVYVHTVNDPQAALTLLDSGVSGIYTDTLTQALLDEAAQEIIIEGELESNGSDGENTEQ